MLTSSVRLQDDDDADSYGAAKPSSPVSDGADSGDEGHHRSGGAATAATGATCLDAQVRVLCPHLAHSHGA